MEEKKEKMVRGEAAVHTIRIETCLAFDTLPLGARVFPPFFPSSLQKHNGRSVQERNGRPLGFFRPRRGISKLPAERAKKLRSNAV